MFLRISSPIGLLVLLVACGGAESPPPPGDTVDCAIGAGAGLSPVCTLETVPGREEIVIHHPDGGFRRITRDRSTGMLASLDGAEPLVMQQSDSDALKFAVGADIYRLPLSLLTPAPQ